jgi:hypothetical protein
MVAYLAAYLKDQRGGANAQIWRDLESCESYYSPNEPRGLMHDLFIRKFEIKPDEESLTVDELKRRYPLPVAPAPPAPVVAAPAPAPTAAAADVEWS